MLCITPGCNNYLAYANGTCKACDEAPLIKVGLNIGQLLAMSKKCPTCGVPKDETERMLYIIDQVEKKNCQTSD